MINTDKVLIGLGQHISGRTVDRCGSCPYFNGDSGYGVSCRDELLDDLYELLEAQEEAQEPRVLTLTDVLESEVLYAEYIDKKDVIPVLFNARWGDQIVLIKPHLYGGRSHKFSVLICDYGKRWRCWTSRPTDEQRKAVKWE